MTDEDASDAVALGTPRESSLGRRGGWEASAWPRTGGWTAGQRGGGRGPPERTGVPSPQPSRPPRMKIKGLHRFASVMRY